MIPRCREPSPQSGSLADLYRVWQVRRFCQARYDPTQPSKLPSQRSRGGAHGDAALSALLRCLLYELDADLAAISLLDDRTQYFLAVAHAATIHDLSVRRADWFGCEQIPVRGGICERTVAQKVETPSGEPSIYEISDLLADDAFCRLPVVDGRFAAFRYYAGVPIATPGEDGMNVGALFIFKNAPQMEPLPAAKRDYMFETARHTMEHLMRTIGAIDNARSLAFNAAVASFLNHDESAKDSDSAVSFNSKESVIDCTRPLEPQVYHQAARLLSRSLDLRSVHIQELPRPDMVASIPSLQTADILAGYSSSGADTPVPLDAITVRHLLTLYPSGTILQLVSDEKEGLFAPSTFECRESQKAIQLELWEKYPGIQQFIFAPLRNSFHDRHSAFIFGWTSETARVYNCMTDLPLLTSFGTTIMTKIRRIEAQVMSRQQSDFLGSISHEMRSPLHGILACIEHLQDTLCTAEQADLLESAAVCGGQLKHNIDNVLLMSNIGKPDTRSKALHPPASWTDSQRVATAYSELHPIQRTTNDLSSLVSDIAEQISWQYHHAVSAMMTSNLDSVVDCAHSAHRTIVTIDSAPEMDFALASDAKLRVIVHNLMDNCLKFTRIDACVRISLESDADCVNLIFKDSGQGISSDFIRHRLFETFAQQDPVDSGLGLGLTLVQSAVQDLGGTLKLDSDESVGTTVCVALPRARLALTQGFGAGENERDSLAWKEKGKQEFSSLSVAFFPPAQWSKSENPSHRRSLEALTCSLTTTFDSWFGVKLQTLEDGKNWPQVLVVLDTDLDLLRDTVKDQFRAIWKIVLSADTRTGSNVQESDLGVFASLVGPVSPGKIRTALTSCRSLEEELGRTGFEDHSRMTANEVNGGEQNSNESKTPQVATEPAIELRLPIRDKPGISGPPTEDVPPADRPPKFLLVDDNPINLKIVAMYAKKCSPEAHVLAGGGQEAIDAFQKATQLESVNDNNNNNTATTDIPPQPIDIVVLDLSMPAVTGFDVAIAIRQMERTSQPQHHRPRRTYIAALTGLVSEKDRERAFAAGVDEYITKPAMLKDLKSVVANWRCAVEGVP